MKNILLVEDDAWGAEMLNRRLEHAGYLVCVAEDGEQALAMARSLHPDVVLMDMSLPKIDGWEVTRTLRAQEATRGLHIVALTAHALPGDREETLAAGCNAYFSKPVDFPSLLEYLQGQGPTGGAMKTLEGRILVVDDASANRELIARKLSRFGAEVLTADSGDDCLGLLERETVDLLLLDIMMPGMSGYEVLEELRLRGELHALPVVVISAIDAMDSVIKCIELGADDYLAKPVNWTLLKARCAVLLERKRLQDAEARHLAELEYEQERNRSLMRAVFPPAVAQELQEENNVRARLHENVGVLFADVVGFTAYCAQESPGTIFGHLQDLVQRFEDLSEMHGMEKIKTIGDSYMACSGLWEECENPVATCVACGAAMVRASEALDSGWRVRVGIHCGGVIAGVVGHKRYSFDLWGDTVNTAARVEQNGTPGMVNLSTDAWDAVRHRYPNVRSSTHEVKGKGSFEILTLEEAAGNP